MLALAVGITLIYLFIIHTEKKIAAERAQRAKAK
jgi:hypothetical protein